MREVHWWLMLKGKESASRIVVALPSIDLRGAPDHPASSLEKEAQIPSSVFTVGDGGFCNQSEMKGERKN